MVLGERTGDAVRDGGTHRSLCPGSGAGSWGFKGGAASPWPDRNVSHCVGWLKHLSLRLWCGIYTRYYRLSRLLDELTLARGDGSYPRLIQRLARTWLLIFDDWGLASLSGQGRHDILDDRYAPRGTLLASQLHVEHLARPRRRPDLRRRDPRPAPEQCTPHHTRGRFDEKAVRLD